MFCTFVKIRCKKLDLILTRSLFVHYAKKVHHVETLFWSYIHLKYIIILKSLKKGVRTFLFCQMKIVQSINSKTLVQSAMLSH